MRIQALVLSVCMAAAANAQEVKIVPLEKYDTDKIVLAATNAQPHILFVNVGKAMEQKKLRDAVCAVWADSHVNVAAAEAESLPPGLDPFAASFRDARFGEVNKLLVYVVNTPGKALFVSMPGKWAVVNLHGFDAKLPKDDSERYDRRLRQLMCKGFGLAMGLGMSSDYRCVLYHGSFTPEGIDKTSIGFGFDDNAAMRGILTSRFSDAIFDFPKE
jgi:hypothetical protein